MQFSKTLIVLCVVVIALLGCANAAKCTGPVEKYHIKNGKVIGNRSFMWSEDESKHFDAEDCMNFCMKRNKIGKTVCGAYEYSSSKFGAGCNMYKPGAKLVKGANCSSPGSCSRYAGVCKK